MNHAQLLDTAAQAIRIADCGHTLAAASLAYVVVNAIRPAIEAQALRDAADQYPRGHFIWLWLTAEADRIERAA